MPIGSEVADFQAASDNRQLRLRNLDLAGKALEALDAGNQESADAFMRKIHRSAEDLLALKRVLGAGWIRRKRLDTTSADEKYGRDWLDKDI